MHNIVLCLQKLISNVTVGRILRELEVLYMSILLDRVDEERIKLDLTGAGLELSKAWNKMLEKVKKANSNRKGNEYFIVDLIVACDNGGLTSNKYKAEIRFNGKHYYLGLFVDKLEAFEKYKERKEEFSKILAESWRNEIEFPAYNALMNFKVSPY